MSSPTTLSRRRPPTRTILIAGFLLVAVIVGAFWWFVVRDDSPAAFDIDDAASGVVTDDGDGSTTVPLVLDSADGVWTVDPAAGETAAGFRVDEELSTVGAATAVGRTSDVTAGIVIEDDVVTDVEVVVDMTTLATDESRRDGRMRDALATGEFPTSTFRLAEPIDLPTAPLDGETVQVTAAGELTIKGVTNPVMVTVDARVVDDILVVVGSMPVVFADYGVETPTAVIVLSVADEGSIEFQLFLRRS